MASLEELRQTRREKMNKLRAAGMDPFAARTSRTHTIVRAREQFDELAKTETQITVAGRIMAVRGQGAILFVPLFDGTGTLQAVMKQDVMDSTSFELFRETIDIADFIQVTGTLFTTDRGEQSLLVASWTILTKALQPLPDKWHGLTNDDERYRKRYLDILMNPELRELFEKKTKFWNAVRSFMVSQGFLEIETPTLEVTTGGAEARPFITHHNDFDMDVYLRISIGELWQKRLMAAGFPKTFEIGRAYRNEGSSPEHLQEFTNMEFYWGYADYRDGMKLVRDLYRTIAQEVFGTTAFTTRGHTFDLANEWEEIDYCTKIQEETGIDILSASEEDMKKKLDELQVAYEGANKERLIDTLWKYCRKKISGPAFLINHPLIVAPLAKAIPGQNMVQMFQPLLGGSELGRGYSELNDPLDQLARFQEQQKLIERGDEEAMMPDWEFVEMLEHGMPPTCGFGFGERLFAFLIDKPIRETVLFPLMKPREEEIKSEKVTKIAVAIINKGAGMELWQEMNTVAHLNAAFGGHVGKSLFWKDAITTADQIDINLNVQHAIMIKKATSYDQMRSLARQAHDGGLEVTEFTREMLETTNDRKVAEQTSHKKFDEIEYLGVLVFGDKKKVEELTRDFELYS